MKLKSSAPSVFNQDVLPLYLQAKRQIQSLISKNQELEEKVGNLQLEIQDLESQSVNVKSYCAKCMDQSINQSEFDTDSKLYQKIFQKNFSEVSLNQYENNSNDNMFLKETDRVI